MGRVGFFVPCQSHPISSANPTMPPMQHPWRTHAAPMENPCLSSEVTLPLSVGHPAPPSTPLVRPRTAVCSRGARARRERSGSVAEADGYSGAHRAAAPHASTYATHTAHTAGELPTSSHSPPANPARCTTRCGLLHSAGEPATLRSRRCCTTRCGLLHSAGEPATLHSRRCCTTRCGLLHSAGEPATLRSRSCCTTRCGTLHSAPPQLPFTQPGCPAFKSCRHSRGQCA